MSELLVRLKPFNPKRGNVLRSYTAFGTRFLVGRGWYRVEDTMANYLKGIHQLADDDQSPPAFDICTEAEALAIDEAESKKVEEKARAEAPNNVVPMRVHDAARPRPIAPAQPKAEAGDLTTADLPKPPVPKTSPSFDDEAGTFDDDMAAPAKAPAPVPASPGKPKRR